MNTAQLLENATEKLRAAGIESPRLEARLLLAHVLGVDASALVSNDFSSPVYGGGVSRSETEGGAGDGAFAPPLAGFAGTPPVNGGRKDVGERFHALLARRIARKPLAYILGHKEFWSLDFAVGPGVLVPRPESETLVEEALKAFPGRNAHLRVLDLGTGSGCLLLAFLSERPRAQGLAIDFSEDALAYARENARRLNLAGRVRFAQADWGEGTHGPFDAIFVNPPYLTEGELQGASPEVRAEPRAALVGGADGFDAYRGLAPQLGPLLAPRGRAFVELGRGQAEAAGRIFSSAGLATERVAPDLSGISRCLVLAAPLGNPKESG